MNIKTAEALSGVSRQNIRFYEREGLLTPDRNSENDYREYQQSHIETLKRIRIMRMLDMPLDQIKLVLEGKLTPAEAAKEQKKKLEKQQEALFAAIRFCEEWRELQTLEAVDPDRMLQQMEAPENAQGFFQKWQEDYRNVVLAEREKMFTFIPEEPVTSAREFTTALFAYANANGLDMIITKEGMQPEFTINGIEYTAERFYTAASMLPVAVIRCSVKHPEDFEPDVAPERKKVMKLLNASWLLIPAALLFVVLHVTVGWDVMMSSWEGWALLGCLIVIPLLMIPRIKQLFFNHKQ